MCNGNFGGNCSWILIVILLLVCCGGNGIGGCGLTLWINQDGNRFNNEALTHINMAAPEAACCRGNREAYTIFDQAVFDAMVTDPADREIFETAVADPANAYSIVSGENIEELAQNFGLDGAMLHRNVYTQNMPGSNMGNNVNSARNAARSAAAYIAG